MKNHKNLSRQEKIKLLQAIQEGKLHPESLLPPQVYWFYETDVKSGVYDGPGNKHYTEEEKVAFCKQVHARNREAIIWHEGKTYQDTIIVARQQEGNAPIIDNDE